MLYGLFIAFKMEVGRNLIVGG